MTSREGAGGEETASGCGSSRDVIELNVCRTSEVPCVRYLIGRIVKTYDYINRVVLNASAISLRGYVDNTLPSRCYASP